MKLLTPRELEVLQAIVREGYTPKVHQERLRISGYTWKSHLGAIYDKLNVGNIVDAVITAIRTGLVEV